MIGPSTTIRRISSHPITIPTAKYRAIEEQSSRFPDMRVTGQSPDPDHNSPPTPGYYASAGSSSQSTVDHIASPPKILGFSVDETHARIDEQTRRAMRKYTMPGRGEALAQESSAPAPSESFSFASLPPEILRLIISKFKEPDKSIAALPFISRSHRNDEYITAQGLIATIKHEILEAKKRQQHALDENFSEDRDALALFVKFDRRVSHLADRFQSDAHTILSSHLYYHLPMRISSRIHFLTQSAKNIADPDERFFAISTAGRLNRFLPKKERFKHIQYLIADLQGRNLRRDATALSQFPFFIQHQENRHRLSIFETVETLMERYSPASHATIYKNLGEAISDLVPEDRLRKWHDVYRNYSAFQKDYEINDIGPISSLLESIHSLPEPEMPRALGIVYRESHRLLAELCPVEKYQAIDSLGLASGTLPLKLRIRLLSALCAELPTIRETDRLSVFATIAQHFPLPSDTRPDETLLDLLRPQPRANQIASLINMTKKGEIDARALTQL